MAYASVEDIMREGGVDFEKIKISKSMKDKARKMRLDILNKYMDDLASDMDGYVLNKVTYKERYKDLFKAYGRFSQERNEILKEIQEEQRKMDRYKGIILMQIDALNKKISGRREQIRESVDLSKIDKGELWKMEMSDDIVCELFEERNTLWYASLYLDYDKIGKMDEFDNRGDMVQVDESEGFKRRKINPLAGIEHELNEFSDMRDLALNKMKKSQAQVTKLKKPIRLTSKEIEDLQRRFGFNCINISIEMKTHYPQKKLAEFLCDFSFIKEAICELPDDQPKLEELQTIIYIRELLIGKEFKDGCIQVLEEIEIEVDSDASPSAFKKSEEAINFPPQKTQLVQPTIKSSMQEKSDLSPPNMDGKLV